MACGRGKSYHSKHRPLHNTPCSRCTALRPRHSQPRWRCCKGQVVEEVAAESHSGRLPTCSVNGGSSNPWRSSRTAVVAGVASGRWSRICKSGPCAGAISQPALHAALPFVGVPASAIGKRGTDGSVWTWDTVLRSSMGRQAPGWPPSGPLTSRFADRNGPEKGRPTRPKSTCAMGAMQCRNGIAGDIARALEPVSGALGRLEGLGVASGWLGQSGGAVLKRCQKQTLHCTCN